MYKIKFLSLVAVAILFSGIFSSVAAQKKMAPAAVLVEDIDPVEHSIGMYNIKVNASQLSAGEIDFTTGTTAGFTSYGTTEGDLSGYIFISMNYVGAEAAKGGSVSQVSSGSWSKLIFSKGQYAGSVYGRIVGGDLTWNGMGTPATVSLRMTIDGGTDSLAGSAGFGSFKGELDQTVNTPSLSGQLTLEF